MVRHQSKSLIFPVNHHKSPMARAGYPRPDQNLPGKDHYRYCFPRRSSQRNQSSALQNFHSRVASSPRAKSENSFISNQSRPKTSSGGMSTSVSYKTPGPSSLPSLPRRAKPSENPGSPVEGASKAKLESSGESLLVVLYERNDENVML